MQYYSILILWKYYAGKWRMRSEKIRHDFSRVRLLLDAYSVTEHGIIIQIRDYIINQLPRITYQFIFCLFKNNSEIYIQTLF